MPRTQSTPQAAKPTAKQLAYLRSLAQQTGTSFTYPQTAAQAHREIERLRSRKRDSKTEIERQNRAVQDDMASQRGGAAAVGSDELVGYGSSAAWGSAQEREPTEKQVGYLRHLAHEAGESFTDPDTFAEAEQQIERLQARARRHDRTEPGERSAAAGPRVVHCKRERFEVYVGRGRGSIWGNPFREGRDGSREQVIAKYEQWLRTQPELMARLPQLRGKVLGCWCAPKPCHADVLLRLANEPQDPDRPTVSQRGEPHALLGYTIGGQHRLIVVQRIDGLIRAEDHPAEGGSGKHYLLAEGLQSCGELDALVADYQQQMAHLGAIPAQAQAIDSLIELAL